MSWSKNVWLEKNELATNTAQPQPYTAQETYTQEPAHGSKTTSAAATTTKPHQEAADQEKNTTADATYYTPTTNTKPTLKQNATQQARQQARQQATYPRILNIYLMVAAEGKLQVINMKAPL
jgi:FtsZ-interacting cell division protein ZipA